MSTPDIASIIWEFNPATKMHYLYAVVEVRSEYLGLFKEVVDIANELGRKIGSYILDTLKHDYVSQASASDKLVALRVLFSSDGANHCCKIQSRDTIKTKQSGDILYMFVSYVDMVIRDSFSGQTTYSRRDE